MSPPPLKAYAEGTDCRQTSGNIVESEGSRGYYLAGDLKEIKLSNGATIKVKPAYISSKTYLKTHSYQTYLASSRPLVCLYGDSDFQITSNGSFPTTRDQYQISYYSGSKCRLYGPVSYKDDKYTYGYVSSEIPCTPQNSYLEISRKSESVIVDYRDAKTARGWKLVDLAGFDITEWGTQMQRSAYNGLKFTITQDGRDASSAYYSGKTGDYQIVYYHWTNVDKPKPKGGEATSQPVTLHVVNTSDDAKAAIDAKLNQVKAEIEAQSNLSSTRKATFVTQAETFATQAKKSIASSSTQQAVAAAKQNGLNNLDAVLNDAKLESAKTGTKEQLEQYGADSGAAQRAISSLTALSEGDRAGYAERINQQVRNGQSQIDKAASTSDVATELDKAKNAIDDIVNEAKAKNTQNIIDSAKKSAKEEIERQVEEAVKNVRSLNNLDQVAKDKAKSNIYAQAEASRNRIDSAVSTDQVNDERTKGISAINAVVSDARTHDEQNLNQAKESAKSLVDRTVQSVQKEIDDLTHLSGDTKTAAKKAINTMATQASQQIGAATSVEEAQQIGDKIVVSINARRDQAVIDDAKADALKQISDKLKEVISSIEMKSGLSSGPDGQKSALKQEANDAADQAKLSIQAATGSDTVQTACTDGLRKLDDVLYKAVLTDAKEAAKAEVKFVADIAKADSIGKLEHLSDRDKLDFDKRIEQVAANGETTIDQASDIPGVQAKREVAQKAIAAIVDEARIASNANKLAADKQSAKDMLQRKAASAKALVNALVDVGQEAKSNAILQVDQARSAAAALIDQATEFEQVTEEQEKGYRAIDAVVEALSGQNSDNLNTAKNTANTQLQRDATAIKQQIDECSNLSEDDKTQAKNDIDAIVVNAKKLIGSASSVTQALKAADDGSDKMTARYVQASHDDAKAQAKRSITDAFKVVDKTITDKDNMSSEAKDALKGDAKNAADSALAAIDAAKDKSAIVTARDNGLNELNKVAVKADLADMRQIAKDEINDAVNEAVARIDELSDLKSEPDEKSNFRKLVLQQAAKAIDDGTIDQASDAQHIKKARDDAKTTIESIVSSAVATARANALTRVRDEAVDRLQQKVTQSQQFVDAMMNVAQHVREQFKAQMQTRLEKGITAIKNVPDADRIGEEEKKASAKIDELTAAATLTETKEATKKRVVSYADAIFTDEVSGLAGINDVQKSEFKKQFLQTANTCVDSLDETDTDSVSKVDAHEDRFQQEIAQLVAKAVSASRAGNAVTDARQKAKQQLEQKAKTSKAIIERIEDVDESVRKQAAADIDDACDRFKTLVDKANSVEQVNQQQDNGIKSIERIVKIVSVKMEAIAALRHKAAEETATIESNTRLDAEQKKQFCQQIADALASGVTKLNAAADAAALATVKRDVSAQLDKIITEAERLGHSANGDTSQNTTSDTQQQPDRTTGEGDMSAARQDSQRDGHLAITGTDETALLILMIGCILAAFMVSVVRHKGNA